MTSSLSPGRHPHARTTGPTQTTQPNSTSARATASPPASRGGWAVRLALRVLTAGALAVSAYLHVDLSHGYRLIG